ncbi:MAG: heme ABC exporter ATP-binding protein CcmA [Gammaproteobacteria bacterium]|nr:heme ABC exporter ATP-binding protein CcmA [Gammaproteobacteria bacterium]
MLTGSGLTLWRGTTCLFEELSFSVPAGAALIIEGANGTGKTTLLRVIAGLTAPETGTVQWAGEGIMTAVRTTRLRLAYCGHGLALKNDLSTRANLEFFARLAGRSRGDANEVLEGTGLAGCADIEVRVLSAGQKRRAALARVLLSSADLWLLDEPQTNLDRNGRQFLEQVVQGHIRAGGTAAIVAHQALDLAEVPRAALRLGEF